MFKSQSEFTNSMFGSFAYDPIIARHQDHLLVRMNKLIDWSFVENEVSDCYSTQGQKAYHPTLLLKLLIIQKPYDLSERETCVNTDCNLIFRYQARQLSPPDHFLDFVVEIWLKIVGLVGIKSAVLRLVVTTAQPRKFNSNRKFVGRFTCIT